MHVECRVESLILEDDHEDVSNGGQWSATLLRERLRRGGRGCCEDKRRCEKESLTLICHKTSGRVQFVIRPSPAGVARTNRPARPRRSIASSWHPPRAPLCPAARWRLASVPSR